VVANIDVVVVVGTAVASLDVITGAVVAEGPAASVDAMTCVVVVETNKVVVVAEEEATLKTKHDMNCSGEEEHFPCTFCPCLKSLTKARYSSMLKRSVLMPDCRHPHKCSQPSTPSAPLLFLRGTKSSLARATAP